MPTGIDYLDETWNPVTGCAPISEGCAHCWAQRQAGRLKKMGVAKYQHSNPFTPRFHRKELDRPIRWKKPRVIGVGLMGDLFHDDIRTMDIGEVLNVCAEKAPQHKYVLLTKRPSRMWSLLHNFAVLRNVWLGVTVENRKASDERLSYLCDLGALGYKTWISYEPLLEAVLPPIWAGGVVVGCESGHNRRHTNPQWIKDITGWCAERDMPCWVKQIERPNVNLTMIPAAHNVLLKDWGTGYWEMLCETHGGKVSHAPFEWPAWARSRWLPWAPEEE